MIVYDIPFNNWLALPIEGSYSSRIPKKKIKQQLLAALTKKDCAEMSMCRHCCFNKSPIGDIQVRCIDLTQPQTQAYVREQLRQYCTIEELTEILL